jgi:hypothetical protein
MPVKRDGRRKTEAAKLATKRARISRATIERRRRKWKSAAIAAECLGYPPNTFLTVSWKVLFQNRPDVLAIDQLEARLWAGLRLVAVRAGVPWVAARGPEYSSGRGRHIHITMHLPDAAAMRDAVGVIEGITGAPAAYVHVDGRTLRGGPRPVRGVVAKSVCGGWMLQRNVPGGGGGSVALARYTSKGQGARRVEAQHRLSNAFSAMARAHE